MIILMLGTFVFMCTTFCVIFYKLVIKRVDPAWLTLYLPFTTMAFVICMLIYYITILKADLP
jgi:hypothetical protein